MVIKVEFNPDLALRRYMTENRAKEECLPQTLIAGEIYTFLKKGQRNYWLEGEIPLVETFGNRDISRPKASIRILEEIHFIRENKVFTKGKYRVTEVYNRYA